MHATLRTAGRRGIRCAGRSLVRGLATATGMPDDCDVVIVGGGPAGLALASALASSRSTKGLLNIALVEAGDLSKIREWNMPSDAYSNRVSSLTNVSEDFLRDIGIWNHVDESRTLPMEDMQVWDGVSDARIHFGAGQLEIGSRSGNGAAYMARLVENLNLQRAALRHLDGHPAIRVFDRTKVESIINDGDSAGWPLVQLSTGQSLRARLLIGADGFNSPVRKFAGIQSFGWAYPTHAVVATMQHSPQKMRPQATAFQRFLPTGPIAFLPLSPTKASLVWSTRPELAAALVKSDPAVLASMINAAFRLPDLSMKYLHQRILDTVESGGTLQADEIKNEIAWREQSHHIDAHSPLASALVDPASAGIGIPSADAELYPPLVEGIQPGTIASFPLRLSHAESYIGKGAGARTALVGDAAHTIHPLAGQGLNGGLSDVECLARCITSAVANGGDIGSYTALAPYARERYIQNHAMLSAVDKLHKLYSTSTPPVVWARSVGLEVLNELDALKAGLMLSAGANASFMRQGGGGSASGWNAVAAGVEGVNTGLGVVRVVGEGLRSVAAGALRQASDALAKRG